MKNSIRLAFILFSTIVFLSACHTHQKTISNKQVLLRLNLKQNDSYLMDMDMDMKMDIGFSALDMKLDTKSKVDIKDLSPDKILSLGTTATKMKMDMKMGEHIINYDSDHIDLTNPEQKEMDESIRPLIGIEVLAKVNTKGEIVKAPDYSVLLKNDPKMKSQLDNMSQSFNSLFILFPEHAVKVGDSWKDQMTISGMMPMDFDMNYTVTEITLSEVKLDLDALISLQSVAVHSGGGRMIGKIVLDRFTGMIIESKSVQKLNVETAGNKVAITTEINIMVKKSNE